MPIVCSVLAPIDIAIIAAFLVSVVLVGALMSRKASGGLEDYFLGGRKIPWWILGISSATSNFDMAGTMIIVAVVFSLGYKGFLVELRGGVGLSLAFLMVFLGKWLRRSRVMTSAEWMRLRFGVDRSGQAAHLLSAIANILLSLGMIIYFSKGAGKFLAYFLPIDGFALGPLVVDGELICTALMVGIGLLYTLMSGLYGVVFTDVLQMILLGFTAIFITSHAAELVTGVQLPPGLLDLDLENVGAQGAALADKDPATWEPIFSAFSLAVFMWLGRTVLEGMGGVGGYTDQRFFAARSEREASLLTLEAIGLSVLRWLMVASLVVMGLHLVQSGAPGAEAIARDAEQVLPIVVGQVLPDGVRGLVIAGLIAAAMSTFDSTLNAGASYIVRDLYQTYFAPEASQKKLVKVSHWATVGLCVVGVAAAAFVPNINEVWGLITMGLGAGMFVPLFLRWYWPRLTGWGFAIGTGTGIMAALVFDALLDLPLPIAFPSIIACAAVGSIATSLVTEPTSNEVLIRFWRQINPWGLWGGVARRARREGLLDARSDIARTKERRLDAIALVAAIPFQLSLLLAAMAWVFGDEARLGGFVATAVGSGVVLYFTWYRNLPPPGEVSDEDETSPPVSPR